MPAYEPSREEMLESYRRAAHLDSVAKDAVFKTGVLAHWQPGDKAFWYCNELQDGVREYYYVDAEHGRKQEAFDPERMAEALAPLLNEKPDAKRLLVTDLVFEDRRQVNIEIQNSWFRCDLRDYTCEAVDPPAERSVVADRRGPLQRRRSRYQTPQLDTVSPGRQRVALVQEGNVVVKRRDEREREVPRITTNGSISRPYGGLSWSPDGRYLIGYRITPAEEKKVHYILSSEPGTTRGRLQSHTYDQPGDALTRYEMFIFDPEQRTSRKAKVDEIDFFGIPELRWRQGSSRYFTFEKVDRGHQRFRVIEVDVQTGDTRNIIDVKTNTFIYEQRIFTHYLPDTHEIVWASEKDGWRHLYLVNALTGQEKQITRGEWVVREIDSIDAEKREIWFRASGMNPGEDPYFVHYYRIGFDGNNLVKLTPETGNHRVRFSPGRQYYLDTYSQVNVPPVTELRRTSDGKKLLEVEKADISAFEETGVPLPEVFVAKGRDAETAIWGIVCRPSEMDPGKRYPVIENIYAGPQDSFVPKNFMPYGEMQSMAELGFIVVQIDGMGTANRSKAFHDVCWKNLTDAGFPDRIRWIRALSEKYPYIDTSRVGLYGTSAGGQNAMGGVLFHPGFYKAAVSACGCHDNRVDKRWWNEQWMGYPVGSHYAEQSNVTNAHKLQGDLLLIVGEADTNVPPESTYRVVDALIKADKDFELLVVPGAGHGDGGAYGRRKKRDFFVKHLLGTDPPDRNAGKGQIHQIE